MSAITRLIPEPDNIYWPQQNLWWINNKSVKLQKVTFILFMILLQEAFAGCTVLTIAHRFLHPSLNTLIVNLKASSLKFSDIWSFSN